MERSRWYDLQLVSLSVNAFSSFSLRQKRAFPLMKNSQNAFPSFVTDVMLANNGWVHAASRVYPPELHWLQRIRALRSQHTLLYLWKDTENSGRHQPRWAEGVSPNDAERRLKKHPQVLVAAPFNAQEKEQQTRKRGQCYIALYNYTVRMGGSGDLVSSIHQHRHCSPFSTTIICLRQNEASPFSTTVIS